MPAVSKTEFLRLLNEALRDHGQYREGMLFVAHPDEHNPETATGYTFVPAHGFTGVFGAVRDEVAAQYWVE